MTPFQLNHLFKDTSSKHVRIPRFWELGLPHMNFEGDAVQPKTAQKAKTEMNKPKLTQSKQI